MKVEGSEKIQRAATLLRLQESLERFRRCPDPVPFCQITAVNADGRDFRCSLDSTEAEAVLNLIGQSIADELSKLEAEPVREASAEGT
jgi:hypothetical protein